jgi:CRISPR-associated exonuclease Cas4
MSILPNNLSKIHAQNFNYDASQQDVSLFMQHIAWGLKNSYAAIPSIQIQDLGDRSKYIGASAAVGCLRKAYLDVKQTQLKKHSAKQMFVFERGHQLEEMIRKGAHGMGWNELDSIADYKKGDGIQYVHQHTARAENNKEYNFFEAHIDFIFVNEKELVIKEIKSSASIPDQPYESHVLQVHLQMWLVKQQYPHMKIRGSVVYHNWDTGQSIDYPIKFSVAILEVALSKSRILWDSFQNEMEPEAEPQLYCGLCPFKGDCPKICDGAFADLPRDLLPLVKQIKEFRGVEKKYQKA